MISIVHMTDSILHGIFTYNFIIGMQISSIGQEIRNQPE